MTDEVDKLAQSIRALSRQQRGELLRKLIDDLTPRSAPQVRDVSSTYSTAGGQDAPADLVQNLRNLLKATDNEGGGAMDGLDRITRDPSIMGGKACIRGQHVTVGMIVSHISNGASFEQVLTEYPYLEREDILQALRYAARCTEDQERLNISLGQEVLILAKEDRVVLIPKPRDFVQHLAGLHSDIWNALGVEGYLKDERESWDH